MKAVSGAEFVAAWEAGEFTESPFVVGAYVYAMHADTGEAWRAAY